MWVYWKNSRADGSVDSGRFWWRKDGQDAITLVNHLVHIGGDLDLLRRMQTRILEAYRMDRGISHTDFYQDTADGGYLRVKAKKKLTAMSGKRRVAAGG